MEKEKAKKVQYDLEGAVLKSEQPRWPYKLQMAVVLLVVVMVGSALGSIVFQRYYLREVWIEVGEQAMRVEKVDEVTTEIVTSAEKDNEAELENYLRDVRIEYIEQSIKVKKDEEFNAKEVTTTENENGRWHVELTSEKTKIVESKNENFANGDDEEKQSATTEDQYVAQKDTEEQNDSMLLSEAQSSASSSSESTSAIVDSEESEDSESEKSGSVERVEPDISFFDRFFNPLVDFGADVAVVEFKIDTDGASFKYGENEGNMKELTRNDDLQLIAELVLPEIAALAKQSSDSDSKIDVPTLNSEVEEIFSFTLGNEVEAKLRFEDGRWSLESATFMRKQEPSTAENLANDDDEEESDSVVNNLNDLFQLLGDINEDAKSQEYGVDDETEQQNDSKSLGEAQSSISSISEPTSTSEDSKESEDPVTEKLTSVETSKDENTFLNSFFNPLNDFGADIAVIEFKIDTDGASFKYGTNEESLAELNESSDLAWITDMIVPEITALVKQTDDSDSKMDAPALNSEVEEIFSFTLGNEFEAKLRFEDGRWSLESATVMKKQEPATVENRANDDDEEESDSVVNNLDDLFQLLSDTNEEANSEEYGVDAETEQHNDCKLLGEEHSSISSSSESTSTSDDSEESKDPDIEKSTSVETREDETTFLNRLFDPLNDFGADVAVLEFKIDTDGISLKYGADEDSLTELNDSSDLAWIADMIVPEITALVKQPDDSDSKMDAPTLNGEVEEIFSFSLGNEFEAKLRFEDGRWSLESVTANEQEGLAEELVDKSKNAEDSSAQSNQEDLFRQDNEQLETRDESVEQSERESADEIRGSESSSAPDSSEELGMKDYEPGTFDFVFNPSWDLNSHSAVLDLKIDVNRTSIKYGRDEGDLQELDEEDVSRWAEMIFQKIVTLAKQQNKSGSKVDVPGLSTGEISFYNENGILSQGYVFEAKLRFERDQWTLESAVIRKGTEKTESLEAETEALTNTGDQSSETDDLLDDVFTDAESKIEADNEQESIPSDEIEMDGSDKEEKQTENESADEGQGSESSVSDLPTMNDDDYQRLRSLRFATFMKYVNLEHPAEQIRQSDEVEEQTAQQWKPSGEQKSSSIDSYESDDDYDYNYDN